MASCRELVNTNTTKLIRHSLPPVPQLFLPRPLGMGEGQALAQSQLELGGSPSLLSGASVGSKFIATAVLGGQGGLAAGASAPLAHSRPRGGMSPEARVFRGALWHGEVTTCSMNGGWMAVGRAGSQTTPHMGQR